MSHSWPLFAPVLLGLLLGAATPAAALEPPAAAYARGQSALVLQRLRRGGYDEPAWQLLRARALLDQGRPAEARAALRGLIAKLPHLRDLIEHLRGQALLALGQHQAAAKRFRAAARAKGSRWVDASWRRQADALRLGRRYRQAATAYQHLIRIYAEHPDRADLELNLARCQAKSGKPRQAAERLRQILYRWPTDAAAGPASRELAQLQQRSTIKLKPQPIHLELGRIHALWRGKLYDLALAEIARVEGRSDLQPAQRRLLARERMRIHLKRDHPRRAVEVYRRKLLGHGASRSARRLAADALARQGELSQALELLAGRGPLVASGRRVRADTERIIRLLKEHGRYKRAMALHRKRLQRLPAARRKRRLLREPWLAYRAGETKLALEGLERLARSSWRLKPYALYWRARTHARAQQQQQAIALYRTVLERHPRTYYAVLARSRLVELGQLPKPGEPSCSPTSQPLFTEPGAPGQRTNGGAPPGGGSPAASPATRRAASPSAASGSAPSASAPRPFTGDAEQCISGEPSSQPAPTASGGPPPNGEPPAGGDAPAGGGPPAGGEPPAGGDAPASAPTLFTAQPQECRASGPSSRPAPPDPLEQMTQLITRHGELYPSLRRARTLWQIGMLADARRELRLIAIDFAWARARGRPRWYIHRPAVARIWRGAKPERRRFDARARKIYRLRDSIAAPLGQLMYSTGIFFYGWRFSPRQTDRTRHSHPRAYAELVRAIARQYQLDPNLLWSVMKTESAFRTDVISRAGAIGLMQIMPRTARRLAQEMKLERFRPHQLFVPRVNLRMAGWYLHAVWRKFHGQVPLVAAAYNGGPHNVARWLDQRGRACELDEFIEEIPFTESRRYAKKIVRLMATYRRLYCGWDQATLPRQLQLRYRPHPDY